ncbi:hypothetical protein NEOLEDRAFT_1061403 [Neolentinus lepideus HHB14362 ss-1]|uniref:BTB domain-containing protein n=1 Tax=Neolentinus lepideus HHB14362 ss-1 TaxID=1314782 RepID=A0A165TTW3_9AGAM|nr:hypothetical protein NEOLEDRAFT_1061403 [Neolentinus lepideus HHB14362 ss-1]
MALVPVNSEPQHHSRFYYPDGQVVLKCHGHLYRLIKSILVEKSAFFEGMLSLPRPQKTRTRSNGNSLNDGTSDETAIDLSGNGHTSEEWDHLLGFIFPRYTGEEPSLDSLIAVLNLSSYYDVPEARQYAIRALDQHPDFRAPQRLRLARENRILGWVKPAFDLLFASSLGNLSEEDAHLLGPDVLFDLARTTARIDIHRKRLALNPIGVIHHIFCEDRKNCTRAFKTVWWGEYDRPGLAKAILHPQRPLPSRDIKMRLEKADLVGMGMTSDCKQLTLNSFETNEEVAEALAAEDKLMQEVVDHVYESLEKSI